MLHIAQANRKWTRVKSLESEMGIWEHARNNKIFWRHGNIILSYNSHVFLLSEPIPNMTFCSNLESYNIYS